MAAESELETIIRKVKANQIDRIKLDVWSDRSDEDPIGDAGAIQLAHALMGNTSVKSLSLFKNDIGDEGAIEIAKALAQHPKISYLEFQNNKIGSAGAAAVLEALESNVSLKELRMGQNKVKDDGVAGLARLLERSNTIESIDFSYCHAISDKHAVEIARSLSTNTSLKVLKLDDNKLTDFSGFEFIKMLESNHNLKDLNLECKSISKECTRALNSLIKANKLDNSAATIAEKKRLQALRNKVISQRLSGIQAELEALNKGLDGYVVSGAGSEEYNGIYLMDPNSPRHVLDGYIKSGEGVKTTTLWRANNSQWHLTGEDYSKPRAYAGSLMPIEGSIIPAGMVTWQVGDDDWSEGGGHDPAPTKVSPVGMSKKLLSRLTQLGGSSEFLRDLQTSIKSEESIKPGYTTVARELYAVCTGRGATQKPKFQDRMNKAEKKTISKFLESLVKSKKPDIAAVAALVRVADAVGEGEQEFITQSVSKMIVSVLNGLKWRIDAATLKEYVNVASKLPSKVHAMIGQAIWSCHKKIVESDEDLLSKVLVSFPLSDQDLDNFSDMYFPKELSSSNFIPIGQRWCLPQIGRCLRNQVNLDKADKQTIRLIVRRFIEWQVKRSEGLEVELARLVDETETIHREAFRTTLTEIYKEHGCRDFLKRSADLSGRLVKRFGAEPPSQSTSDLNVLYEQSNKISERFKAFVADLAAKSGGRNMSPGQKSIVRVEEKIVLKPDPADRTNYSSACDIERNGIVYGNSSQISFGLQNLQACDVEEAKYTPLTKDVFGDKAQNIVIVRLKDRFSNPNSSFYSDLMVNFRFANDPTKTILELQLMHNDLTTIRLTGSHEYYGITRSCRELLERANKVDLIPVVDSPKPKLPQSISSALDSVDGSLAGIVQALQLQVQNLEERMEQRLDDQARRIGFLEQTIRLQMPDKTSGRQSVKVKKNRSYFK